MIGLLLAGPTLILALCLIYILIQYAMRVEFIDRVDKARMYARAAVMYGRVNSEMDPPEKRFEWVIARMQGDYPKMKYEFLTAIVYAVLWEVK